MASRLPDLIIVAIVLIGSSIHLPLITSLQSEGQASKPPPCESDNSVCNSINLVSGKSDVSSVVPFCTCGESLSCSQESTGNQTVRVAERKWYSVCRPLQDLALPVCHVGEATLHAVSYSEKHTKGMDIKLMCSCPRFDLMTNAMAIKERTVDYLCGVNQTGPRGLEAGDSQSPSKRGPVDLSSFYKRGSDDYVVSSFYKRAPFYKRAAPLKRSIRALSSFYKRDSQEDDDEEEEEEEVNLNKKYAGLSSFYKRRIGQGLDSFYKRGLSAFYKRTPGDTGTIGAWNEDPIDDLDDETFMDKPAFDGGLSAFYKRGPSYRDDLVAFYKQGETNSDERPLYEKKGLNSNLDSFYKRGIDSDLSAFYKRDWEGSGLSSFYKRGAGDHRMSRFYKRSPELSALLLEQGEAETDANDAAADSDKRNGRSLSSFYKRGRDNLDRFYKRNEYDNLSRYSIRNGLSSFYKRSQIPDDHNGVAKRPYGNLSSFYKRSPQYNQAFYKRAPYAFYKRGSGNVSRFYKRAQGAGLSRFYKRSYEDNDAANKASQIDKRGRYSGFY